MAAALSDRSAFVSPTVRRCTLILDEACDSQSQEEIISFTAVLSYRFRCPVLSVLVHDDDALFYWLHREGRVVDVYQSNPGMFAPPGMTLAGTAGGNVEILAESFESAVTSELHDALRTPHGHNSKYVCETERHRDRCGSQLAGVLGRVRLWLFPTRGCTRLADFGILIHCGGSVLTLSFRWADLAAVRCYSSATSSENE